MGKDSVSPLQNSDEDAPLVMDLLKNIQRELSVTRKENSNNFAGLECKLTEVKSSIDELTVKLKVLEGENVQLKKEVEVLKESNTELRKRMSEAEGNILDLQQYSRRSNLEVKGVPVTTGEDVYGVVGALARALGVGYDRKDISVAHRVRGKFPNIIVQFVSRTTRSQWLESAKRKRLSTTDLSPSLRPGPVFVNDHLTAHNKFVLGAAKQLVKDGRLAYAWTKDGKVLVRRDQDGKATQVWFTEDVEAAALPCEKTTTH